ncbi:MAG: acyl-CoA dehydrogenase family protein [Proteobacteria bacterium]|nr:acyl-CoA dehydrogenase family protein [Pseudomonadota bacterium]
MSIAPVLATDPLVEEAASRAFSDLAEKWFAGKVTRENLLTAVEQLGFAEAAPGDDNGAWLAAAAIIRAQARAAAPIDMALLLATGDRAAAIAHDPSEYFCAATSPMPASASAHAALSLGRCLQIGAALGAALELSIRYAQDRKQFGRALAQFQAIQHSLALAAEEVAACTAITDLALACAAREGIGSPRLPALLDAAALVAGHAVNVVYDMTHQVHGAIGFTQEYALHRHSLDLLRWRDHLHLARGGDIGCAERLGDAALAAGSAWRAVTANMTPGATP